MAVLCLGGCSLFEPKKDELAQLTEEVLKKGEGVEIDVKPIPQQK